MTKRFKTQIASAHRCDPGYWPATVVHRTASR